MEKRSGLWELILYYKEVWQLLMLRYYWWWLLWWSVPWPYPGSGVLRCRQSYLLHQCLASSKIKPFGCTCMQHGYKYWEGGTTSCSACTVDQRLQASWWQQIFEMWLIVMPQTNHDTTIWLCLVANEEINNWLIGKQLTINNAQPISVEANKLSITHYQHWVWVAWDNISEIFNVWSCDYEPHEAILCILWCIVK